MLNYQRVYRLFKAFISLDSTAGKFKPPAARDSCQDLGALGAVDLLLFLLESVWLANRDISCLYHIILYYITLYMYIYILYIILYYIVYAYVLIYIYTYMYVCMYVCVCICICICICLCLCVCICICISICICICICICVCMYVCMYMRTNISMFIWVCIYNISVFIYIYRCILTWAWSKLLLPTVKLVILPVAHLHATRGLLALDPKFTNHLGGIK